MTAKRAKRMTSDEIWAWLGMRRTGVIERSYLVSEPKRAVPAVEWILTAEERRAGYVRPYRLAYTHERCRRTTHLLAGAAERLARNPHAFDRAWCLHCKAAFRTGPWGEFVWKGSTERVGT